MLSVLGFGCSTRDVVSDQVADGSRFWVAMANKGIGFSVRHGQFARGILHDPNILGLGFRV